MLKHKALVLMQIRTKCVKMAEFLFRRQVPDVPSPLYSCGKAPETPEYVLFYCPETEKNRQNTRKRIALIALRTVTASVTHAAVPHYQSSRKKKKLSFYTFEHTR
jgi:hypothetical protein